MTLPPAVRNAAWPQFGGNPAHVMGHLSVNARLAEAWTANIGEGGGYRAVIMAQPVVDNGVVYTMDSEAVITAFTLTMPKDDGLRYLLPALALWAAAAGSGRAMK